MTSMKFQQEITDSRGKPFSVRKVKESTPSDHECQGRKDDMRFQTATSESAKRERLIAEGWITEWSTKELPGSKANRWTICPKEEPKGKQSKTVYESPQTEALRRKWLIHRIILLKTKLFPGYAKRFRSYFVILAEKAIFLYLKAVRGIEENQGYG